MDKTVEWAAQLEHVRDVTLFGTADLAYWKERLQPEHLRPAEHDSRARLLLIAADARFKGVRFRELSVSVLVCPSEGAGGGDGAYLVRAFNSCRLFAFVERKVFSTPYSHGDVRVTASLPVSVQLLREGALVFSAVMGATGGGPEPEAGSDPPTGWEGTVFLPANGRTKDPSGRLFFARIKGETRTYPFLHPRDSLAITPSPGWEVVGSLKDSGFVATEWHVRADASHAKSRTYSRDQAVTASAVG